MLQTDHLEKRGNHLSPPAQSLIVISLSIKKNNRPSTWAPRKSQDCHQADQMGILGKIKRQIFRWLPDTNLFNLIYSEIGYVSRFGRLANVRRPRCFNEHLMRLKCSDEMRRPLRTFVSDKELVKIYVRGCLGEGYTPKTLAILRQPEEIERYAFPSRFAAKPAHGFNDVIIKRGEVVTPADRAAMKRWIGENYFHRGREPQYRFVEPKRLSQY